MIDLRKVTELRSPDTTGPYELQCAFQIVLSERTYHLRADSPTDADAWLSALKHTQVSGIPLGEQQLTSNMLPILVHKCLQFIESYGMDVKGLYRLNGEKAKIRRLILAFNQGTLCLCGVCACVRNVHICSSPIRCSGCPD